MRSPCGQGAVAPTVSDRVTSAADGTREAGALGDAESVGGAEPVGDAEPVGVGVGVGVGVLDGAGDGEGEADGPEPEPEPEREPAPEPELEPDCGRERAIRLVGAVAETHGVLGEVNTGGELWAWGFDLTVTSGRTDGVGAAA